MEHTKVAVIGSGPAGYSAAVYTARALLAPAVFTGPESGGQLMYTTEVENFAGFAKGIQGPELMFAMREQAERFGAQMRDELVTAVDFSQRPFKLWTELPEGVAFDAYKSGKPEELAAGMAALRKTEPQWTAESVIISTGASSIMLGIPGEKELLSKGVSTCAVCDAAFFRDKITFVVGGGDSAMEDATALAKFAKSVTIIHRRDSFRASKIMQDRVLNNPKISVLWNTEVLEIVGTDKVEQLKIKTNGKEQTVQAEGIFMAIGHRPTTQIFADQIQLDAHGYVVTRQSATKIGLEAAQAALTDEGLIAYPTMTSVEGVFAAGDNVDVRYKQAITAAGQGCSAALDAERWLERQ